MNKNNLTQNNVNSVDTNENKTNGDDIMNNEFTIDNLENITNKTLKKASKTELVTIARKLRQNRDQAIQLLDKAQEKINNVNEGLEESNEEINRLKTYIAKLETNIAELEQETEDAQQDIDHARALIEENDKFMLTLARKIETGKTFIKDISTTHNVEKAMVNDHGTEINRYKNKIAKCKNQIKKGIDVDVNRGLIRNYEAQIRYQQEQKDVRTLNEMNALNKKNGAKNRLVKNESELAKRQKWADMTKELFGVDKQ